jgi:hypothetical protein
MYVVERDATVEQIETYILRGKGSKEKADRPWPLGKCSS